MDDLLLHLEKTVTTFNADSDCNDPGAAVSLSGGANRLTVVSTGNASDPRALKVNDTEVITLETLKAYATDIVADIGTGPVSAESNTAKFVGRGSLNSPLETVVKLPSASENIHGVVKVVHEGSHGFPCAGFSYAGAGMVFDPASKKAIFLRNGADDLENDVFISWLQFSDNLQSFEYTPTADRFRIPSLPSTAKPTYVEHSCEGVILLRTTDGPFFIFHGNSLDIKTWKACKIANPELQQLEWQYFPVYINNTIYLVKTVINNTESVVEMWKAGYVNQSVLQLTKSQLSGTNHSGQAQSGQVFKLFNKSIGTASEKPLVTNPANDMVWINVARLENPDYGTKGDCYDYCVKGNKVRVLHRCTVNFNNRKTEWFRNCQVSYVLDLSNGAIVPDVPGRYPAILSDTPEGSTVNDRAMVGSSNADWSNRILRSNGITLTYNTWGRGDAPHIVLARNNLSSDTFDSIVAGVGNWSNIQLTYATGSYGSVVKMSYRGVIPIGDNYLLGNDRGYAQTAIKAKYDPYGSYSPRLPGYGPTNDRTLFDYSMYDKVKRMLWVYDGDTSKVAGAWLSPVKYTNGTTFENDVVKDSVTFQPDKFEQFIDQLMSKVTVPGTVLQRTATVNIIKERGLQSIAALTVIHEKPNSGREKFGTTFMFRFTPNVAVGTITSWSDINLIGSGMQTNDAVFGLGDHTYLTVPSPGLYKLRDGNWVMTAVCACVGHVGNWTEVLLYTIFNPSTGAYTAPKFIHTDANQAFGFIGTKELGFGLVQSQKSGEGLDFISYGFTAAEIASGVTTKYTLIMTRTDAGDNVTISQMGATKVRERILSLVPPTRKVNGMDLSRDRIVSASHIGGDQVPNQRDITYPVQQKHRDGVIGLSVTGHTHPPSAFTMAAATTSAFGGSVLGDTQSADNVAFRVDGIANLSQLIGSLNDREKALVKLDLTVDVDYEV